MQNNLSIYFKLSGFLSEQVISYFACFLKACTSSITLPRDQKLFSSKRTTHLQGNYLACLMWSLKSMALMRCPPLQLQSDTWISEWNKVPQCKLNHTLVFIQREKSKWVNCCYLREALGCTYICLGLMQLSRAQFSACLRDIKSALLKLWVYLWGMEGDCYLLSSCPIYAQNPPGEGEMSVKQRNHQEIHTKWWEEIGLSQTSPLHLKISIISRAIM